MKNTHLGKVIEKFFTERFMGKKQNQYKAPEYYYEFAKRGKELPELLFDLLSRASPHGTEGQIINLLPFKDKGSVDAAGNFIIQIGEEAPETLFSCHMDTVHSEKRLVWPILKYKRNSDEAPMVYGSYREFVDGKFTLNFTSSVLGADDKLGVYALCKLIEKGVKGLYIFHVGEERGGIGSKHIATKAPELLKGIKRAIAFDRRGYDDVIGSQKGDDCCSKEFGKALADALNGTGKLPPKQQYSPGARGTFTDTANYTELVPECTNVSCGYFNEHGCSEHFDPYWYLNFFLPAILEVDYNALPTVRDHTKKPVRNYYGGDYSYHGGGYSSNFTLKPEEIRYTTPLYKVPKWDPDMGLYVNISREGMVEIVAKWISSNQREASKLIVDLLVDYHLSKYDNQDLMFRLRVAGDHKTKPVIEGEYEEVDTEAEITDQLTAALQQEEPDLEHLVDGPLLAEERVQEIIKKFMLIDRLGSFGLTVGLSYQNKDKHKIANQIRRLANIRTRAAGGENVDVKDYAAINDILVNILDVFISNKKDTDPVELVDARKDAIEYLSTHWYENGVNLEDIGNEPQRV
jgi:hypothetical protein